MTGGRGSHRGGNAGGSMPRVTALAPAVARLPTGRTLPAALALVSHCGLPIRSDATSQGPRAMDCYGLLRLQGGVSHTAGALPRGSTIFRLPRPQQQMPDFRVLTRKIDCINCSDTFNRRRL